jgi:hypothetical protein
MTQRSKIAADIWPNLKSGERERFEQVREVEASPLARAMCGRGPYWNSQLTNFRPPKDQTEQSRKFAGSAGLVW